MALSTKQAPAGQLKRPHFHLVWKTAGQPNASWKWQLFGYYWRETPRRLHLVFSTRGLMLWAASLSFAAYLAGAAVLVAMWDRSPYNQVGYLDVVLPTRWSDLRALRGKGLIAEGIAEIKAKRYAIGIMRLTQGVGRNPKDFTGRLELARIYLMMGRVHQAQQFLSEGLRYGEPPRALREALLTITFYLEDYEGVLSYVERLRDAASPQTQRELNGWQAKALEKLWRNDDLDALRQRLRASTPSIAVESAWARSQQLVGAPQNALSEIRKDRARFGTLSEALELQIDLAVAAHDRDAVEEALRLWFASDPAGALPRIHEIVARYRLGEEQLARSKISDFLVFYGTDTSALPLLFRTLVELNDPAGLKFAYQEARSAGAITVPVRIYYVQGLLLAGEFQEARIELAAAEQSIKASKVNDGDWAFAAHRLLDAVQSPSESTSSLLLDHLTSKRLNPEGFRFVWRVLARGRSPSISDVSILARNRFPAIRFADNEEQVTSEIASIHAASRAERAKTESPPPPTVPQTQHSSRPERIILNETLARRELREVDELIGQGNLDPAREVLLKIERANIEAIRPDVALRRIQIHGEKVELSELTSSLLVYLRSPAANQTVLRSLAERWNNPKQRDSALTLLRETRSKFPGAKWTSDIQKRIERTLIVQPSQNITEPQ